MDTSTNTTAGQSRVEQLTSLVRKIARLIDDEQLTLSNRDLLDVCREFGTFENSDPHLFHEVAEAALNLLIAEKYGSESLVRDDPEVACTRIIRPLQLRIPTQSWRSRSQVDYQQFSTPAPIAYLMAYLLNLTNKDIVLEPSCGTGSLAAWALAAGATLIANEIDPRRMQLCGVLGIGPTAFNAEYIDDFLPVDLSPNVVMMNPPFSANGGRTRTNSSRYGFRHVESALRRLAYGGRFGVILGPSGSPRTRVGREFWERLKPAVGIAVVFEIDGREFYRHGTTVNTVMILGRKGRAQLCDEPVIHGVSSIEEAFSLSLIQKELPA